MIFSRESVPVLGRGGREGDGGKPDRHDIDEVLQQALARLTLLSGVTAALSSTLSTEEAVRRLCRILVPQLADWCVVDLLDEQGRPYRVAVTHRDPERLPPGGSRAAAADPRRPPRTADSCAARGRAAPADLDLVPGAVR
nr:hypothetical protein GCM10020093_074360 [Planobispora longispora]